MPRPKTTPDIFIKVTTSRFYAFDSHRIDNRTPEQIIKEFFQDYPLEYFHATRDTHRVGNSTRLLSVEHFTREEAEKEFRPAGK